jgi:hypothetical protein
VGKATVLESAAIAAHSHPFAQVGGAGQVVTPPGPADFGAYSVQPPAISRTEHPVADVHRTLVDRTRKEAARTHRPAGERTTARDPMRWRTSGSQAVVADLWQVKDSNLRSFRDGFTVRRIQRVDQHVCALRRNFRTYSAQTSGQSRRFLRPPGPCRGRSSLASDPICAAMALRVPRPCAGRHLRPEVHADAPTSAAQTSEGAHGALHSRTSDVTAACDGESAAGRLVRKCRVTGQAAAPGGAGIACC